MSLTLNMVSQPALSRLIKDPQAGVPKACAFFCLYTRLEAKVIQSPSITFIYFFDFLCCSAGLPPPTGAVG